MTWDLTILYLGTLGVIGFMGSYVCERFSKLE